MISSRGVSSSPFLSKKCDVMLMARADDFAANQNMLFSLKELAEEAVAEMAPYTSLHTPLPSPSSKSTPPASPLATITNKKIRSLA